MMIDKATMAGSSNFCVGSSEGNAFGVQGHVFVSLDHVDGRRLDPAHPARTRGMQNGVGGWKHTRAKRAESNRC